MRIRINANWESLAVATLLFAKIDEWERTGDPVGRSLAGFGRRRRGGSPRDRDAQTHSRAAGRPPTRRPPAGAPTPRSAGRLSPAGPVRRASISKKEATLAVRVSYRTLDHLTHEQIVQRSALVSERRCPRERRRVHHCGVNGQRRCYWR